MNKRIEKLDHVFEPKSIAFVGATEEKTKWGYIILNNLITGGYRGKLFPVNPSRTSVLGFRAYPSVSDIPEDVDLAICTIPSKNIVSVIQDCVKKDVAAAIVITSGFRELGERGAKLEELMLDTAKQAGMVLVGPNGQGVCNPSYNLFAWMPMDYHPPAGQVAVVSQSGNIQMLLIVALSKAGYGLSKSASSGNEADIRIDDYIEYFAQDTESKVILCYTEGITYGRQFFERARKASLKKPVVVIKGGVTQSGIEAAASHTGALAVNQVIFDSVCRQAGIIQADRLEEAALIAASFLNRPLPRSNRVAIITGGGGLGVIASDWCTKLGLEVSHLSEKTLSALGRHMPDFWVPGNPIDLVATLRIHELNPIVDILMQSGEVDTVLFLMMGPPPKKQALKDGNSEGHSWDWKSVYDNGLLFIEWLHDKMYQYGIPVFLVSTLFKEEIQTVRNRLGDRFWALHPSIESACICIKAMSDYSKFLQLHQ